MRAGQSGLWLLLLVLGACNRDTAGEACEALCDLGNDCRALTQPASLATCCTGDDTCGLANDGGCQCPDSPWDSADCAEQEDTCVRGCLEGLEAFDGSACRGAQAELMVCRSDVECGDRRDCLEEVDAAAQRCAAPGSQVGDGGVQDGGDNNVPIGIPCGEPRVECDGNAVRACAPNGEWQSVKSCAADERCVESGVGPVCEPVDPPECTEGERRCGNIHVETCYQGEWHAETFCAYGCEGYAMPQCSGDPSCSEGEELCDGDQIMRCNANGMWMVAADCWSPDGGSCLQAMGIPVCTTATDGLSACLGDYQRRCSQRDGKSVLEVCLSLPESTWRPCLDGEVCMESGDHAQCVDY